VKLLVDVFKSKASSVHGSKNESKTGSKGSKTGSKTSSGGGTQATSAVRHYLENRVVQLWCVLFFVAVLQIVNAILYLALDEVIGVWPLLTVTFSIGSIGFWVASELGNARLVKIAISLAHFNAEEKNRLTVVMGSCHCNRWGFAAAVVAYIFLLAQPGLRDHCNLLAFLYLLVLSFSALANCGFALVMIGRILEVIQAGLDALPPQHRVAREQACTRLLVLRKTMYIGLASGLIGLIFAFWPFLRSKAVYWLFLTWVFVAPAAMVRAIITFGSTVRHEAGSQDDAESGRGEATQRGEGTRDTTPA